MMEFHLCQLTWILPIWAIVHNEPKLKKVSVRDQI